MITIRKAERRQAKLRLGLIGPSGSGKTYSALQLAFGLGGKVGLIDTEHGSGELYADLGDYDVIQLEAPYTVQRYREAIKAFEAEHYDTIIIDSLTHAWAGEGGLLDKQGQLEKSGKYKNSYVVWRELTPDHNKLVEEMLTSPAHIIATIRSKTEYVLEKDDRGHMVPRKVGLAPVQRDGMEYEFTIVMDVADNHYATASKDRTSLFDGWSDRIGVDTGRTILDWLESGKPMTRPTTARQAPQTNGNGATHISAEQANAMSELFMEHAELTGASTLHDQSMRKWKIKEPAGMTPADFEARITWLRGAVDKARAAHTPEPQPEPEPEQQQTPPPLAMPGSTNGSQAEVEAEPTDDSEDLF